MQCNTRFVCRRISSKKLGLPFNIFFYYAMTRENFKFDSPVLYSDIASTFWPIM